jgi:hypothetical protein
MFGAALLHLIEVSMVKNLQKFKGSEPEFGNLELFPKFGTELRTANLEAELNHNVTAGVELTMSSSK